MLSESQERMLLVAEKGREHEVLAVFEKWGLDCAEVGIVTADDVMRVYHGGVLEAEIPNKALTDEAPVYHRAVGTWDGSGPEGAAGLGARRVEEAAGLYGGSEEAAGVAEYLLEALDL